MIYLDNAATTVHKPQVVIDAVVDALKHLGNAGRGATDESLQSARTVFSAREEINTLINGEDARQIAFSLNVTEALNTAIRGLLHPGDHVISSVMEHNSVIRPLNDLQDKGVEVTYLPMSKDWCISPEDVLKALKPNTKALVLTHASNVTGNINPIKEIVQALAGRNILVILDAAQSAGAIPIDVQDLGVDVLCFTGHKSLLGPQGTGGLYVRKGLTIDVLKSGGTGVETFNPHQPLAMPTHLEAGTLNGHGLAGLAAAVEYILNIGVENIHQEELQLMNKFYQAVTEMEEVKVYGNFNKDKCPIVSLNIGDWDSSEVSDRLLEDFGIATRSGGHCAPLMHQALGTVDQGLVRFSFSHFTTEEEVEEAIKAVRSLAEEYRQMK
ncbi:aminotransferase class V-fold PLP-dependent enzyme [Atopobacter sp. AH10]|uniref:aminotransferase class V-fold PLP-dependent enzyme n=1 Tax=Atopobacter sp. AH10 TaxID=2315861 RepID=UPI000EF1A6F3|nr:aminotransferase class V-fold PLP-dependent enzyme [Atopobacter sp. AH10]RLK64105.1 aminotransferase class V-fold PLP-dependent enzyme [Atopobacter sp. AH10]